jgi:hypothetical protein
VIFGSQVRKLILSDLPDSLKPFAQEYKDVLNKLLDLERQDLLNELGLKLKDDGSYEVEDVSRLMETLRQEAIKRTLPDNIVEMLDTFIIDNKNVPKYPLDANPARERIESVLNSIVDNRIIKVSGEEEKSGEIYTYRKYPEFLNSIDKYNNNFIKFFYLVKENIAYKVKANKKRCTTKTILTSLKKNNQDFLSNKLYFSKIINLYIDEVFFENKNIKLFIVIHPWEIHLNSNNNEYFYFDNFLTEIISKRTEAQNIHLIDFKKYYPNIYLDSSLKIKDIFVKNDPTSHLTPKAHRYFIKEIIEQIEKKAL